MKKNIYIFRHGQTDKNLNQIWQGSASDDLLNENGIAQAQQLAQKAKDYGMTALYCSPLLRAVQTANAIAKESPYTLPVIILQNLKEGYFGQAESLKYEEVRRRFPDLIDEICSPTKDNWDLRYPDGESKHEMFNRIRLCLDMIICESDDTVGIVCHAGLISTLRCGLNLDHMPHMGNCSVLHLEYDTDSGKFEIINS